MVFAAFPVLPKDSWQAKHAALAAVKQTVEYVEEQSHVEEMAKLLLAHVDHPHPRHLALEIDGHRGNSGRKRARKARKAKPRMQRWLRVRFTALHGLGQLANDQSPHFQETSHQQVMPVLTRKMDDQVERVASMAMSAFVSFGEASC